jgi:hypothetical protein
VGRSSFASLDPAEAARLICATSGPTLSADQWAHYANGTPYRQTC